MTSNVSLRAASRSRNARSWISTIWRSCARSSREKRMMSSIRLRNSGRNCWRTTASTACRMASSIAGGASCGVSAISCEPMLLVMMITVFLKSTVRPWPSVSRPSSST